METGYVFSAVDLNDPQAAKAWDTFVDHSSQGMCFYRTGWVGGLNNYLGHKNLVLGIYDEGELVGGIALSRFGKFGLHGVRRPFATPYCNPIFARSVKNDRLRRISSALLRFLASSYDIVAITYSFLAPPCGDLPGRVQSTRAKSTLLLKLNDLSALWKGFQGEVRNRIRKAEKQGVSVRQTNASRDFYLLYCSVVKAQGKEAPFTEEQFCGFCNSVQSAGLGRVYEARDADGRLHTAALVTFDARTAFYTLSATDPELRVSGANSLLLWEIFRDLSSPIRSFDMVGTNVRSLTRFKKHFGGTAIEYPEHIYYSSWLVRLLATSYDKLRLVRQFLSR
jgi:hypothetical protein